MRVRHYDDTARIELPAGDLVPAAELGADLAAAVQAVGYQYVTLDLAGLRSGNLNRALTKTATDTAGGVSATAAPGGGTNVAS